MMIDIRDLDPGDLSRLSALNQQLQQEIDAVNRSLRRLDEAIAQWCCADGSSERVGPVPSGLTVSC